MRVAGITVTAFAQSHRLSHGERSCGLDHGADLLAEGPEQGCDRSGVQDLHGCRASISSIGAQPDLICGF
jgi:hypothetical protein